ncbi:MAG TPA: hypothetical protein VD788_00090 [Candidatus Polarisedimenticolaceae bacterium]|nr:hypothetical protein [Candidatus Polarisedimenticolaceae bacterium]
MKGSTATPPAVPAGRLRHAPVTRRIPGRNYTKGEITLRTLDGKRFAVKDYRPRPFLMRQTLGRYLVGRECRAYHAAGRIDGLARYAGRVDRFALATEWVEGRTLNGFAPGAQPADLFERLAGLLRALHERGVALADLHRRDVIVGPRGELTVVDLAAAWMLKPGAARAARAAFVRLCCQDEIALARMRAHYHGEDEAAVLAALDPAAVARYRRARAVKSFVDRVRRGGS